MITLRPFQEPLVAGIRGAFQRGVRRVLAVAPTSFGKSVVLAYIAKNAGLRGKRVGIFVHQEELADQLSETMRAFEVPHLRIAASAPRWGLKSNTFLVMVSTYHRRMPQVPKFDLMIVDEAHRAVGRTYTEVREFNRDALHLGFTATPQRLDGKPLGDAFDEMVIGPSIKDLIQWGREHPGEGLCDYRLFAPNTVNTGDLRMLAGDYRKDEAEAMMDKPTITGDAVEHYRKYLDGKPAFAFTVSVAHAEHVAQQFRDAGYERSVSLDGSMDKMLRKQILRDFKEGRVQMLSSCALLNEGVDAPGAYGGHLLRPTASLAMHMQQIGRMFRPVKGVTHKLIFDHVGNWERHGLPDDDREWSLDGAPVRRGAGEKQEVAPGRRCPKCLEVAKPGAVICGCGFRFPVQARQVEQVAGTLGEVDVEKARRERSPEQAERLKEQASARSLEALIELGRIRGYANPEGWARHLWEARTTRKRA